MIVATNRNLNMRVSVCRTNAMADSGDGSGYDSYNNFDLLLLYVSTASVRKSVVICVFVEVFSVCDHIQKDMVDIVACAVAEVISVYDIQKNMVDQTQNLGRIHPPATIMIWVCGIEE